MSNNITKIIMKKLYEKGLILVGDEFNDDWKSTTYLLYEKCNIVPTGDYKYLTIEDIEELMDYLGNDTAKPFYRNFPQSVVEMPEYLLMLDQIITYVAVYGPDSDKLDDDYKNKTFSHSIFEGNETEKDEVAVYKAGATKKRFKCIKIDDAYTILRNIITELLETTRPWSESDIDFIRSSIACGVIDRAFLISSKINSKTNLAKLYVSLNIEELADKFTLINQVLEVVYYLEMASGIYGSPTKKYVMKHLTFNTSTGKRIRSLLERVLENRYSDKLNVAAQEMAEKRDVWIGLLNRIHVGGKKSSDLLNSVNNLIRLKGKDKVRSIESTFYDMLNDNNISTYYACNEYVNLKGPVALLRKIAFVASKCDSFDEYLSILDLTIPKIRSTQILWQLLKVSNRLSDHENRVFNYVTDNRLVTFTEDDEKYTRRTTVMRKIYVTYLKDRIVSQLKKLYKESGTLGKVFVHNPDKLSNVGLTLSTATSSNTLNFVPTGTKIDIPKDKIIRAFTSWRAVDDLDICAKLIHEDGEEVNVYFNNARTYKDDGILFSGDETRGFEGGVEYFDVDINKLRESGYKYMTIVSIIFSTKEGEPYKFDEVEAYGGYMLRDNWFDHVDKKHIEEARHKCIYDIKTVSQRHELTGNTNANAMFCIDLENNQIIWLNLPLFVRGNVINQFRGDFVKPYIDSVYDVNMLTFAEISSDEIIADPKDADTIITSDNFFTQKELNTMGFELLEDFNPVIIRPTDYEKVLSFTDRTLD